jgi:drug/metabolite transporter (DMT)-like permease
LVTAVAAALMLGERLTSIQISGGLMVIAGVFIANLPRKSAGRTADEKGVLVKP